MSPKKNLPLLALISSGFIAAIIVLWVRSKQSGDAVDRLLYGGMFAAATILLLLVFAEWFFPAKRPLVGEGAVKGSLEDRIESGDYTTINVTGGEIFVLEEAIVFISAAARYDANLGTYTRQSSRQLMIYSVIVSAVVVAYSILVRIWFIALIYSIGFAWFFVKELLKTKKPVMVVYPKAALETEIRNGRLCLSVLQDGITVVEKYRILPSEAEAFRELIDEKEADGFG